MKLFALLLFFSGLTATVAFSDLHWWGNSPSRHGAIKASFAAPEIDPASAVTALTLLLGGVTVLRSRTARK
jgi:hypothetical protein